MIHCSKCSYSWNPDTATNCIQCKVPLGSIAQRGDTAHEASQPYDFRRKTIAEGIPGSTPAPPMPSKNPDSRPDVPGWKDVKSADRPDRKIEISADKFSSSDALESSSFDSGSASPLSGSLAGTIGFSTSSGRRPQTVAVDPTRKIVGVLITYSWLEQGQIFPVLEGRNLIGKDPNQCDICIPQDATLSAVNSFITYRRQFVIGDKVSMSGTDVDGEPIETEFVPLKNYAKIRTGSTLWTFVAVQPPQLQTQEIEGGV